MSWSRRIYLSNDGFHDAEHPSYLVLPVIPDAPEIEPVKPPLSEFVSGVPQFHNSGSYIY